MTELKHNSIVSLMLPFSDVEVVYLRNCNPGTSQRSGRGVRVPLFYATWLKFYRYFAAYSQNVLVANGQNVLSPAGSKVHWRAGLACPQCGPQG